MFVSLENQPKSLSQLRQLLSEVEQVESQAIEAVTKAIASYKSASLSPEYWEGFASQIFSLFPSEVVRKGQPTGDKFVEALRRENEDLRENLQALEQEIETWKTKANELANNLNAALFTKGNEINDLRKQLTEWESKGNQLANELIESSVRDREDKDKEIEQLHQSLDELMKASAGVLEKNEQAFKEEKALLVQGFEERVQFFSAEIERYRKLEEEWGARFAQQAERIQELESREPADDIIYERVEAKVKEKSDLYAEFIKLSDTAGYLKVRESGEILAAYVGTNNQKNENGRRLVLGKSILKDWQSHFQILHSQSKSEIRKGKRLTTDWEMKITNLPFEKIEKLGTYDYTQPPQSPQKKPETKPEIELKRAEPFDALCPEYHVLFNGEEYGRVWRIPGKLPHAWKHNLFGPNDKPFNSPEGAAKALVEIEREADKEAEDDSNTPEF